MQSQPLNKEGAVATRIEPHGSRRDHRSGDDRMGGGSTLEKISRTGVFTVATRTASPPFGYTNKQNEWVGFSIDLAKLVHKNIEKKLNKSIKFEEASGESPPPL